MQHLPVPATGAAHSLDGWHHRGSPPSLHARVRYWPAKWGRSQNTAVDFHFSSPLYSFRIQKKMDSCSEHYTLWNLIILDFFNHLYLRTLQFFFRCFLHGPCEREDALHTSALHQHLTKMWNEGTVHWNKCFWKHKVIICGGVPICAGHAP